MWSEFLKKYNGDARFTSNEIKHQPELWRKIWQKVYDERKDIKAFLDQYLRESENIVLTGAGTSAYIGIAAQHCFRLKYNKIAEPISTTHIVSHPRNFFLKDQKLFLVSFARSGNSPESCAVLDLAEKFTASTKHLIITCNEEGKLAKEYNSEHAYVFILPPEANDKSLAMTSSFTGMLLSSILISRIDEIEEMQSEVEKLASYGEYCLSQVDYLHDITQHSFKRAMFLGSGSMYGVAKEAQLKMQELTDGVVIGKHDSFLGLRHGPKAVINDETLIIYHFSNDNYARKYELDLAHSLKESCTPAGRLAIGENIDSVNDVDWKINLIPDDGKPIDPDLFTVVSIVPAQILALFKSLSLGMKPDNPSRNGAISRVVQGVNIYNF